jgi:ribosomal protein S18 acetylase RimI-like enzyme
MRVNPDYHRRGFGQAILNQLEVRASELGYKELCLDTTTTQIPAQKLYEKNGFTEVGREKIPDFELILYRKKLKP